MSIQEYNGAEYPSLADYFGRHERNSSVSAVKLSIALALLALFFAGCNPPNIG
jgi:hypothetical protein